MIRRTAVVYELKESNRTLCWIDRMYTGNRPWALIDYNTEELGQFRTPLDAERHFRKLQKKTQKEKAKCPK